MRCPVHRPIDFLSFGRHQDALLIPLSDSFGPQRTLQSAGYFHHSHTFLQWKWHRRVLQNRVDEFLSFGSKGVLEALPVLPLNLMGLSTLVAQDDIIGTRYKVDLDLPFSPNDLGTHIVAICLCPATVEVGDLAAVEF